MGFFDIFRKKTKPEDQVATKIDTGLSIGSNVNPNPPDPLNVDMTLEVSDEEKELVALIASAIASGDNPEAEFRVASIKGIDVDKEVAAAIVSAIAAGDNPNSNFILKSIKEIK